MACRIGRSMRYASVHSSSTMRSSSAKTTLIAVAARVLERDEVRSPPPILAERRVGFALAATAAPSAGDGTRTGAMMPVAAG
jgi:hypothetical protein